MSAAGTAARRDPAVPPVPSSAPGDLEARDLVERLLTVLDTADAALQHAPQAVAPLHRALSTTLRDAGLERLDPTGEEFDPVEQHAVEQLPAADEQTAGPVVEEVLRPGYRWRGRLLRPALVCVRG